jgi:hypothetical protein
MSVVAGVTIAFRPFQHLLTAEEQLACVAAIRRHLAPNGRLVFDLLNPSIHNLAKATDGTESNEDPPFTLPDGRVVVRRERMLDRDLIIARILEHEEADNVIIV